MSPEEFDHRFGHLPRDGEGAMADNPRVPVDVDEERFTEDLEHATPAGRETAEPERTAREDRSRVSAASLRAARVLVVDEPGAARSLIAGVLRDEGHEVCTQSGATISADHPHGAAPDLTIVSARAAGDRDGRAVTSRALGSADRQRVVVLLDSDSITARRAALAAGADDCLARPVRQEELRWRARALLGGREPRGREREPREVRRHFGDVTIDDQAQRATRRGRRLALTRIQYRLLRALVEHRREVVPKRDLLAEVWGFERLEGCDINLVEVQVSHLRRSLEAHGPRLIWTLRGEGYVLREDGEG